MEARSISCQKKTFKLSRDTKPNGNNAYLLINTLVFGFLNYSWMCTPIKQMQLPSMKVQNAWEGSIAPGTHFLIHIF